MPSPSLSCSFSKAVAQETETQTWDLFPCINDWQKHKPDPSTEAHLIKMLPISLSLEEGHMPLGQRSAKRPADEESTTFRS